MDDDSFHLTPRESQLMTLLAAGQPNKQIAYQLGISVGTVKVNVHTIMNKTRIHNRTRLAVWWIRQGWKTPVLG